MRSSRERDRPAVEQVLGELGIDASRAAFWGAGVASETWRVGQPALALRFMRKENPRRETYTVEHALLTALHEEGAPVPDPVARSGVDASLPEGWKAWAIEEWLEGRTWSLADGRGPWEAVGRTLARVHAIRASGFGPLRASEDGFRGTAGSMDDGLAQRWSTSTPWFGHDDRGLANVRVPGLRDELTRLSDRVAAAVAGQPAVVLHSDLHQEHVLVDSGRLVGILDFGGAFLGPAAWDFAAIGVFNGWPAADAALDEYERAGDELRVASRLVALSFAVYRLNVETADGNPAVAHKMLGRLVDTLDELRF